MVIKIELEVANIKQSNLELKSDISALKENISEVEDIGDGEKIQEKLKSAEEDLRRLEQIIPEFRKGIKELQNLIS